MYLFLNTLSDPCFMALFDEKRVILHEHVWVGKQKEFDTLIETIDGFLKENDVSYTALLGIAVVVGPGGFTGTRVTTLVVNTLAYSFGTPIFSLTI